MRKVCHISFSSHQEVLCRCEDDLNYLFNCFAIACMETESRALADTEMTTHAHFGTLTDNPDEVFRRIRYSYTRYFNFKYGRRGSIGENKPFVLSTEGIQHTQVMISYVLRQALHHGLSDTPFGYPYGSVNVIFKKALGKNIEPKLLSERQWYKYLPKTQRKFPENYRMDENGLLFREDVIDTSYVEEIYISPRTFLYHMNRYSNDNWKIEQEKDGNGLKPISMIDIEPPCFHSDIPSFLINESSRSFRPGISDLELCWIIDNSLIPTMARPSIYSLSDSEKNNIGNQIYFDIKNGKTSKIIGHNAGLPDLKQIKRCLNIR